MVKENPTNTAKLIIPKDSNVDNSNSDKREELLEELKKISPEEIEELGDKMYLNRIKNKLAVGYKLGKKEAKFLITHNNIDIFLDNINKFKGLDKEIAMFMIENGYLGTLYEKLEYFEGIDKEVVMKFIKEVEKIENNEDDYRDLEKFKWILDKEIAMFMIENGYLDTLYENLEYFEGIDKEVVKKYIEKIDKDNGCNLHKFERILDKEIAMFMIENGYLDTLYENLEYFEGIDKEVVKKYIEKIDKDEVCHLYKFEGILDKEIAMFMIENGYFDTLCKNLEYFKGINKEIAITLAEHGAFVSNLKIFPQEERQEIVLNLLEHGYKPSLQDVPRLDFEFANKLIERKEYEFLRDNIQYFFVRYCKDIALSLLEVGCTLSQENLRTIKNKDKKFAMTLLNYVQKNENSETSENILEYIINNPGDFNDLDNEVATILIDMGYGSSVKKHKKSFKNLSTYTKMRILMK